uniref:Uncharacterized protein n=1 Tax=Mimivirus LCMiAC01 TaxID=2506608 RepID=A0A481YZB4_9VIRU|nr:MAG: hypothetical protein LCMiAC01_02690 [Mimivirus LCMiAC01]
MYATILSGTQQQNLYRQSALMNDYEYCGPWDKMATVQRKIDNDIMDLLIPNGSEIMLMPGTPYKVCYSMEIKNVDSKKVCTRRYDKNAIILCDHTTAIASSGRIMVDKDINNIKINGQICSLRVEKDPYVLYLTKGTRLLLPSGTKISVPDSSDHSIYNKCITIGETEIYV